MPSNQRCAIHGFNRRWRRPDADELPWVRAGRGFLWGTKIDRDKESMDVITLYMEQEVYVLTG